MRVAGRLDHQRAAVELDEQVVVVAGQNHIGRMSLDQIGALLAVGVHHHDHEIDAVAPQRLGLRLDGGDGRQELHILGVRHARRAVVCASGQPDPHVAEADDIAVLDAGKRLFVRPKHVGGKHRELHLRHSPEENGLAEIEFMIARYENVRLECIGECNDMRALVDPRHQRRRQRVAAMREQHVAALGAFGLHYRGETGKAAADAAVRHRGLAHLIDVVG